MNIRITSILLLALLAFSCTSPTTDQAPLVQKVSELESQVEVLQSQLNSLQVKAQISTMSVSIFDSPLDQFFQSDDFWRAPVDVGEYECSKACIKTLQKRRAACFRLEGKQDRIECFEEAAKSANACHSNCRERFN